MTTAWYTTPDLLPRLIPQRAPFILVDGILEHSANHIVSCFTIPASHLLVDKAGRLTEAGIIEHFAQTIALYEGYNYYLRQQQAPMGYIGTIKNLEIYRLPAAGQKLHTTIQILEQMMDITMVSGTVYAGETPVAAGDMRTVIAKDFGQ